MGVVGIIGVILMILGALFLFLGGLGILRMPDVYNRLQAGTKATTLGAMSLILGAGLYQIDFLPKALVLIVFIALTNPISSSVLARASHRRGVKPILADDIDAYEDFQNKAKGRK